MQRKKLRRIVNIVDSVSPVNYGIWNAAIVNAAILKENGIETELWFPDERHDIAGSVTPVRIASASMFDLRKMLVERGLDATRDIIVTHGSWQYATRWGNYLRSKNFIWIYVPQGMLEPWSRSQKRIKKKIYFDLFEKRLIRQASGIRAVSMKESTNLKKIFPQSLVEFIPNGVDTPSSFTSVLQKSDTIRYLFLSRLHHKKNIVSLAQAWTESSLNNSTQFELLIAGPDQGELETLRSVISRSSNIRYVGTVFGEEKKEILCNSHFFVLPSFSEGLPSALLEAMGFGLIPIITEGCNFSDAFSNNLGVKITTERKSITRGLEETSVWNNPKLSELSRRNFEYIKEHYSVEKITQLQLDFIDRLMNT
jgi:glycosyltransferase involved in cell wall biosynthesis